MAKKKNKRYPKRLQEEARRMAKSGRTSRQIARDISVPKFMVKRWTASQREARNRQRAKRLRDLGRNPQQISIRLDTPIAEVERWLAAPNVSRVLREHHSGFRHGTDTRKCARKMAELGDAVTDIALVVDVTQKTVRSWLRAIEVSETTSLLPGGHRQTHDRKAILQDLNAVDASGRHLFTRDQLREKYGCCRKFLSQLANGKLEVEENASGRRRHDRAAILRDLSATDGDGRRRFTRTHLRKKYGCSSNYLSQLATGKLDP